MITQPTLSRQLKDLEQELGESLFIREHIKSLNKENQGISSGFFTISDYEKLFELIGSLPKKLPKILWQFLFFYFRLVLFIFNMCCNYHILIFTNIKYFWIISKC